jgi:hypothetical protein
VLIPPYQIWFLVCSNILLLGSCPCVATGYSKFSTWKMHGINVHIIQFLRLSKIHDINFYITIFKMSTTYNIEKFQLQWPHMYTDIMSINTWHELLRPGEQALNKIAQTKYLATGCCNSYQVHSYKSKKSLLSEARITHIWWFRVRGSKVFVLLQP